MAVALEEMRTHVQEIERALHEPRTLSTPSYLSDDALGEIVRSSDRLLEEIGDVPPEDVQMFIAHGLLEVMRIFASSLIQERHPDQAWFWTPEWQRRERSADAQIAAGLGTRYDNDEAFLASLG